jgi:hypothetical protein
MPARPLQLALVMTAAALAAAGTGSGQSPPPPCPPGTVLATVGSGTSDDDATQATTAVATHHLELGAQLHYDNGAAISSNESLTITPPPGLATTPVPNDGDPSEAGVRFVAPAAGTLAFTATWTQLDNYTSNRDCTASAQVPVDVAPAKAIRTSHIFGAMQHWAGHPGTPINVLSLGWELAVDAEAGDATPVTVSVRAVAGNRLPTASTPAVTSTWNPLRLLVQPTTARSALVRLRSATLGLDDTATNKVDLINASVYVYPPHGRGTVRRGIAIDVTQGPVTLAHYRLRTTCRKRPHRLLDCKPRPGGGT